MLFNTWERESIAISSSLLKVAKVIAHPRLKIDHDCTWNISLVICLIEEDVLAIMGSVGSECVIFQHPIVRDSMFSAQLSPEFATDCIVPC